MPKVEDSKIGIVSWFFLLGLFALCWYWGFQIGATALTDPDTCWLLAVGRWILAHGALPQSDPFSWTLQDHTSTYLPYQWLATAIFYALYTGLGTKSLLFFVSFVVLLAFLVLPLCLARKLGVSLWCQVMLSALAISAGSFHFPLRPELFSYFFLAIVILFVMTTLFAAHPAKGADSQAAPSPPSIPVPPPAAIALPAFFQGSVLFVLWANLHSGFVLGLLIVSATIVASAVSTLLAPVHDKGGRYCLIKLIAFLIGALIGSLITPFQFRLYVYLPGLFFSPMNRFNQELLPLRPHELLSSEYLPFLILQLLFIASLIPLVYALLGTKSLLRLENNRSSGLIRGSLLCFALLAFVSFGAGDLCRRMISFAVLISFAYFMALARAGALEAFCSSLKVLPVLPFVLLKLGQTDDSFNQLIGGPRRFPLILAGALICIGLGTGASASQFPATIPQTTYAFEVPLKAVGFIQKDRPPGNLLNDPQFGDVLIFSMDEKARVFIDTRFDLYGPGFCHDYFIMANGLDGYEKLLEGYKIDWIFFPQRAPVLAKLSKNARWRTVFQDTAAVIMIKPKGGTK